MLGRLTDRTYIHRTFPLTLRWSRDYGQPARFVVKVFDCWPPTAGPAWPALAVVRAGGRGPRARDRSPQGIET
jgi:hypothetical protein